MDCLLIRHGIAVESEDWNGPEKDRPLTQKGEKRLRQVAAGLVVLDCKPTHLLTSPFVRAYETARLLRDVAYPTLKLEKRDELAVGSSPEKIVALLRSLPVESVVWCVGHEPLLGEVAGVLLFGRPAPGMAFKKAGAALIRLTEEIAPGQGVLRWWLQPMQMRALGKS
jgi:phosphohistidine phosphatase